MRRGVHSLRLICVPSVHAASGQRLCAVARGCSRHSDGICRYVVRVIEADRVLSELAELLHRNRRVVLSELLPGHLHDVALLALQERFVLGKLQ